MNEKYHGKPNRLTHPDPEDGFWCNSEQGDVEERLFGYEEVEEAIGIGVETLFKAMRDGVYAAPSLPGSGPYPVTIEAIERGCLVAEGWVRFRFADYGKSWALTKKELEEKE